MGSRSDWRGQILATIRRIMLESDPGVTEDWKWMGTPVWYCDGIVCLANPYKGKVKWTFSNTTSPRSRGSVESGPGPRSASTSPVSRSSSRTR